MANDYLESVRHQYEEFPYPPRDPAEERRRLLEVEIDRLTTINFYCFGGTYDFQNARVLVAGGGTGDSTMFLAEQLAKKNGEVVYLDISRASMAVAQERAEVRKLTNIRFIHGSITTLTPETAGLFDYISCTGVLHHLDDPASGLQRLKSALKPTGGMGIMLYAAYGRTGVYQLQRLMRLINTGEPDMDGKIANTRRMLLELPETNWFRHNERLLSDHKNLGDSGLVDLLLHDQDVPFTVDQVYALTAGADLNLIEFSDVRMRMSYRPELFIHDPELRAKIARLDRVSQQSIAELVVGAFRQHVVYLSPNANAQAQLGDLSHVPFFFPSWTYKMAGDAIANAMRQQPDRVLPFRHATGFEIPLQAEPVTAAIFANIDGVRDWRQIFTRVRGELPGLNLSDEELLDGFRPIFEQFRQLDWMLLRAAGVGEFPETVALQVESERR